MRGVFVLLAMVIVISGCGRRLPPDCRDYLDSEDYGRFEVKDQGIARDTEYGIEWFRCSVGQRFLRGKCVGDPLYMHWESGVSMVEEMNEKVGEHWRLPTLKELASLRIEGCHNPSVNMNVFPEILVENYWAIDESPHFGFRCGMYTFSGATSCRLFDNLERPLLIVRDF